MRIKKRLYILVCLVLVTFICTQAVGCNQEAIPTEDSTEDTVPTDPPTEANSETQRRTGATAITDNIVADPDVDKFDIQKYMYPIWESNTSYAETVFVRENEYGIVEPLTLLYPIEEIISVRSYDLRTLYEESVDYTVNEDGQLEIISNGSIPVLSYDKYYLPVYDENGENQMPAADDSGGAYIHSEITRDSAGMSAWMISVTYRHSEECCITKPTAKTEKFKKLIEKLENGEEIDAVFYGDSITYGWAATGAPMISKAPRCPVYTNLVTRYITQKYGVYICPYNFAVSGKTATWGADLSNLRYVYKDNPDLVILAFGMNDGCGTSPETYIQKINYMVSTIAKKSPDTCVVVVGTMLPNEKVGFNPGTSMLQYQDDYAEYLVEAEKNWSNAAFADVTTVHQQMLERKVFQDTTSSNTNHPNDYMHRVYAQVIFQTIFGDYT